MKKTDLEKRMAKKLDGRMKSTTVPQRFGAGSVARSTKTPQTSAEPGAKLVAVSCRLPADLVNRLREQAAAHEGGMNSLLAAVAEHWFASVGAQK